MSRKLRNLAVALVSILALATGLLAVVRQDRDTFPSPRSHGPSGTLAFAELLRAEGIDVVSDRTAQPKLRPGDVGLSLFVFPEFASISAPPGWIEELETSLDGSLTEGASIISTQIPADFQEAREAAKLLNDVVLDVDLSRWEVTFGDEASDDLPFSVKPGIPIFRGDPLGSFAVTDHWGSGHVVNVSSGTGITNQFIERGDNAAAWLHLVKMQLGQDGRVVFLEAAFAPPQEAGKLASIGLWLQYAWWQVVLVALVVAYSLGKPFGYEWAPSARQRGSRDLADALSSIMARAKHTESALSTLARRVRSKYSTDKERVRRAEEVLRRAQEAPTVKVATQIAIELERDQPEPPSQ